MTRESAPDSSRHSSNFTPTLLPLLALGFLFGCPNPAGAQEPPTPLVFQAEPQDTTVTAACNASLSALVVGDGLTYQWYFNNEAVLGGSTSQLNLVGVTPEQTGGYQVVVSLDGNSITSRVAQVTVTVPTVGPQAISNPGTLTAYRGQNDRVLLVQVVGTANAGNAWGTDIYTDDSSLSRVAVHMGFLADGEAGTMAVRVLPGQNAYLSTTRNGVTSAAYGSWVGSYAPLYLVPNFTAAPIDQAAWVGNPVSFEVQTTSPSTVRYQWQHNGVDLPGETAAKLTLGSVSAEDAGVYSVIAANDNGSNASPAASLVVIPKTPGHPAVAGDFPHNGVPGEVVRTSVTGESGSGRVWGTGFYTEDSSLAKAAVHVGLLAPGETQTLAFVWLPGRSNYLASTRHEVSSASWDGWRLSYALLGIVPTLTDTPITQAARVGDTITFNVQATSPAPVRYQWRHNGGELPGATGSTLTLESVDNAAAGTYEAIAINDTGMTISPAAQLFVVPKDIAVLSVGVPSQITWGEPGTVFSVPVTGVMFGSVYGDGLYTWDSSLGSAAVHAGFLQPDETGTLEILIQGNQPGYLGTTRHGVTSYAYGPGGASFVLLSHTHPAGTDVKLQATGVGALQVHGQNGLRLEMQASTTLLPGSWVSLEIITLSNATQDWFDPSDGVFVQRFYRALTVPNP